MHNATVFWGCKSRSLSGSAALIAADLLRRVGSPCGQDPSVELFIGIIRIFIMPTAAMLALTAGARSISVAAVRQFVRVLTASQWIPKIWQLLLDRPINRRQTQPADSLRCKQIRQLHRITAYVLGVPTTGVRPAALRLGSIFRTIEINLPLNTIHLHCAAFWQRTGTRIASAKERFTSEQKMSRVNGQCPTSCYRGVNKTC